MRPLRRTRSVQAAVAAPRSNRAGRSLTECPKRGMPVHGASAGFVAALRSRPPARRRVPTSKDWIKLKKQVLVSVDRAETRVALLEGSGAPAASKNGSAKGAARKRARPQAGYRVAELYIERRGQRSIVGNIYKGKVDNVLPGLEAAFVDIGLEKNGFLHVDEIVLPGVETV